MGYLLLGADGFLGSQVRRGLERRGLGTSLVAVGGHGSSAPVGSGCTWRSMDPARVSVDDLTRVLRDLAPAIVVNAFGSTDGDRVGSGPVNAAFAMTLVEALARVGASRLVHLGSAAEYGIQPAGSPIAETASARPVGAFGTTKIRATELIVSRMERHELTAVVLRVFDAVGSGAPERSPVGTARRCIQRALRLRSAVATVGQLAVVRDFLAGDDVAEAVVRIAGLMDVPPILNVGRGVAMSGRSMVELLAAAAGFDGDVLEPRGYDRHPPAAPWQQADVSLLRSSLQWVPATPIADAVAELWWSGPGRPAPGDPRYRYGVPTGPRAGALSGRGCPHGHHSGGPGYSSAPGGTRPPVCDTPCPGGPRRSSA